MQAPDTTAPRHLFRRDPVAVTVAPIGISPMARPQALGGPPSAVPVSAPMPMPNAIAAGRAAQLAQGTPTAAPTMEQTMGPIAYAMQQYKEAGDPFAAAAEGFINARQYKEQQAADDAKAQEAAKMLDGYPDLQASVGKGIISLDTGLSIAKGRADVQKAADRKKQIYDALIAAGNNDIAEKFNSGLFDEDGVQKALQHSDEMAQKVEGGFQWNPKTGAYDIPVGGAASAVADLPTVGMGEDGLPDTAQQTEFLSGLDQQTATLVQGIASYQMDLNTVPIKGGERARIASLVKQFDPTYQTSQYPAVVNLRKSLTTGPYSQALQSANLVIQHLAGMEESMNAMGNQGGLLTPVNNVWNPVKAATGDTAIKAFRVARDGAATELAKVFRATGAMSESEIKEWKSNFGENDSPDQVKAATQKALEMLQARIDTIRQAYKNGTGRPQDFTFLTAKSAQALSDLGIEVSAFDPMAGDERAQDLAGGFSDVGGTKSGRAGAAKTEDKPDTAKADAPAEELGPVSDGTQDAPEGTIISDGKGNYKILQNGKWEDYQP